MRTTDKTGIFYFIDRCLKQGMRNVVCSPGSRNAPLIIAIDEHPLIEAIVIHDERSAAFYALGMAQQLDEPVGVVCTSGSAMLNYYPAVAEAYYQCIPIVVLSADRPEEWINQGDGQTIVQRGVYANHIRYEGEVPEYLNGDSSKVDAQVDLAFDLCNGDWKGPIHFNIPISEPLYGTVEKDYVQQHEIDITKHVKFVFSILDMELVSQAWSKSDRKMILCGQLSENSPLLDKLSELANDGSLIVMVENTSNLNDRKFIHCIDRTLSAISENEIIDFQPDLLISIGGAVISKRIKKFLRTSDIKTHWKIGHEFPKMDTYRKLTKSFECSPSDFFSELLKLDLPRDTSTFGNKWKQKDYLVQEKLKGYIDSIKYSDLKVFETILDYIPENSILQMGNSSVVRYCQLFDPIKSFSYYSNRGTSGIDGCTSTACGAALIESSKCNVLITGDISFFYDSNALWSNYLPSNLRILLVNNSGGGIFKIIDGPSSTSQLEKYFEAKHDFSAEHLCKAFNVGYYQASSIEEIENEMASFYMESKNNRPKLIEIFTSSEVNDHVLKEFFKQVSSS